MLWAHFLDEESKLQGSESSARSHDQVAVLKRSLIPKFFDLLPLRDASCPLSESGPGLCGQESTAGLMPGQLGAGCRKLAVSVSCLLGHCP